MNIQSEKASLTTLPEELQLEILEHLASAGAPSERKARHEPSLELTMSANRPLKNLSCVSKHWRRISLPTLFRYARLRLFDTVEADPWPDCPACSVRALTGRVENNHSDDIDSLGNIDRAHRLTVAYLREFYQSGADFDPEAKKRNVSRLIGCVRSLHHSPAGMVDFIKRNDLNGRVESLVVVSGQHTALGSVSVSNWNHPAAFKEAIHGLWWRLLDAADPRRIVIVAPPRELAPLAGCTLGDLENEWAFTEMDFHLLELSIDLRDTSPSISYPQTMGLETVSTESILRKRPWTGIHLNEGSHLRAYGTYEYFERGPPSIVVSIRRFLLQVLGHALSDDSAGHRPDNTPSAVKRFAYTAIFPFVADRLAVLAAFVEEIDLQLAPDPQSGLLDDKARVGKADLSDCWTEFSNVYRAFQVQLCESQMPEMPLQRFIASDYRYPSVVEELKDTLGPLIADPKWMHRGDGVFTRRSIESEHPEGSSVD